MQQLSATQRMDDRPDDDDDEDGPDDAPAPAPAPPAAPAEAEPGRGAGLVAERLLKSRQIQLFGQVNDKLAERVIAQLLALEADDAEAPITLIINSPGGSVSAGLAIYDVMRYVRPPVRVLCVGLCASIATIILLGAAKGDRLSLPSTRFLIHQPLLPATVYGPASDLEITARELLKTRERINTLLARETGQPLERIERDTQRDYWMVAEEAIVYGLVARVVQGREER